MVNRIERVSLVDEAYNRIKQSILSGGLKEGAPILSEHQYCKLLSVSRVVVREALQRLRSERLIVTYHGKGSFVANPKNFSTSQANFTDFNYDDFSDIMQFRSMIEYSAIGLAVERATDDELNKIVQLANELATVSCDQDRFNLADYNFHIEIIKASHNKTFVRAMESVQKEIMMCLKSMNQVEDSRDWAISLHNQIAQKLLQRDGKGAIDLLKHNGEYNLARMKEIVKF